MLSFYQDPTTHGIIRLIRGEAGFFRQFFDETITGEQSHTGRGQRLLTIAWNIGPDQRITIDGVNYTFPTNTMVPLVVNQTFKFDQPERIVAWQFDREFYCIIDHDKEVSCSGLLFYGALEPLFLQLSSLQQSQFQALLTVFDEEFDTCDTIQGDMLRMLLKRLIIKLTRLVKEQYDTLLPDSSRELIRHYRMLVEQHYRQQHQVSFYADQLNKSPKTLTNVFALHGKESPLQTIHSRIGLEAKRLLLYTSKSTKEITYELGFDELAHFSRFFKNMFGLPPSDFRVNKVQPAALTKGPH